MRVPDRQKQRQAYLKKKAVTNGKSIGGCFLLVCLLIFTAFCGILTCGFLIAAVMTREAGTVLFMALCALLTMAGGHGCSRIGLFFEQAYREEAAIPYVPPLRPESLPAEEVLVRGAQEPVQEQSASLLRAAEERAEASAEELLRAVGERPRFWPKN
jgi:hypothetical protein